MTISNHRCACADQMEDQNKVEVRAPQKVENDSEVLERRRRLKLVRMPNGVWMRTSNGDERSHLPPSPAASRSVPTASRAFECNKSAGGERGTQSLDSSADDSIYCSISAPTSDARTSHLPEKVFVSRDTQTASPHHDLSNSAVRFLSIVVAWNVKPLIKIIRIVWKQQPCMACTSLFSS